MAGNPEPDPLGSAPWHGTDATLQEIAEDLLRSAGRPAGGRLEPLSGGANNRVFRVVTPSGDYLFKVYFRHPDDCRNRLASEFAFLSYAVRQGIRCVPQPLAQDEHHACALYEFIEGRRLRTAEVDHDAMQQSLRFYDALSGGKDTPEAQSLPCGSEACFSLAAHLQLIDRRVERLKQIPASLDAERQAADFRRQRLEPLWNQVREFVVQRAEQLGMALEVELDPAQRCISPSDFGFHNALLESDGRLRFIDFEYAGWDDPMRMVCDFFCRPTVPAPLAHCQPFARWVANSLDDSHRQLQRFEILFPVYHVKWCCIVLNHFLPLDGRRRRFAQQESTSSIHKLEQLQKAQTIADRVPVLLTAGARPGRASVA